MNEIKKSLIEAAGDMSESKKRVKMTMHQQPKPHPKRNFLTAITVVAVLGLFFIVTSLLLNNNHEVTQATLFDKHQYNVMLKIKGTFVYSNDVDEEYLKQEVYDSIERNIAYYVYAESLGYEITKTEIENSYEQMIQFLYQSKESKQSHKEWAKSANLSLKDYERYIYSNTPYRVAQNKLEEHFMEQYPKIDRLIANQLAIKNAVPYFRQHYTGDIQAFKKKLNLPLVDSNLGEGTKLLGRVVEVEDNMFLVESYLENERYWVPQDNIPDLSIGDIVEVFYKMRSNDESPYVTDIWDLKMIDDYMTESSQNQTINLTIPEDNISKVKAFIGMLRWDEANFEMSRPADYQIVLKNITYQIWSYQDGFVLLSSRGEYRKLNEDFTEELSEYLGLK
ncbi:hypothetical protein SAMN05880501_11478 [Ureibacillus xyleni]|uniref:Uncharacterized protein n=1 Tax=Ureibacillus xyleni TaxID=614648 RepID=A0A285TKC1_9BACL|nr:hypothetical protein [Ureibacillus xyleni]SOC22697.1 hypothetical protein SAMN05880501_11478 [Ureibacillus xyleni]